MPNNVFRFLCGIVFHSNLLYLLRTSSVLFPHTHTYMLYELRKILITSALMKLPGPKPHFQFSLGALAFKVPSFFTQLSGPCPQDPTTTSPFHRPAAQGHSYLCVVTGPSAISSSRQGIILPEGMGHSNGICSHVRPYL